MTVWYRSILTIFYCLYWTIKLPNSERSKFILKSTFTCMFVQRFQPNKATDVFYIKLAKIIFLQQVTNQATNVKDFEFSLTKTS